MKTFFNAIFSEITFDLDDLTPLGWVILALILFFAGAVGVVNYKYIYPMLQNSDVNALNRRAYAFVVIAPFIVAALIPLCIGIPIMRRFGLNFTKTDKVCREFLTANNLDSRVEHYLVFEVASPTEELTPTLVYNSEKEGYTVTTAGANKVLLYKLCLPKLRKISVEQRSMKETARLAETKILRWTITKQNPSASVS